MGGGGGGVQTIFVKRCIFGGAREKGVNTSVKVGKFLDTVHIVIKRCVRRSQRSKNVYRAVTKQFSKLVAPTTVTKRF